MTKYEKVGTWIEDTTEENIKKFSLTQLQIQLYRYSYIWRDRDLDPQ